MKTKELLLADILNSFTLADHNDFARLHTPYFIVSNQAKQLPDQDKLLQAIRHYHQFDPADTLHANGILTWCNHQISWEIDYFDDPLDHTSQPVITISLL